MTIVVMSFFAGIGIGLFLAAVAAGLWFLHVRACRELWRYRRRAALAREAMQQHGEAD